MESDQLFREVFAGLEVSPSAEVWEHVEKALEDEGRKRPGIWWLLGILLLALGGAVAFWVWPLKETAVKEYAGGSAPLGRSQGQQRSLVSDTTANVQRLDLRRVPYSAGEEAMDSASKAQADKNKEELTTGHSLSTVQNVPAGNSKGEASAGEAGSASSLRKSKDTQAQGALAVVGKKDPGRANRYPAAISRNTQPTSALNPAPPLNAEGTSSGGKESSLVQPHSLAVDVKEPDKNKKEISKPNVSLAQSHFPEEKNAIPKNTDSTSISANPAEQEKIKNQAIQDRKELDPVVKDNRLSKKSDSLTALPNANGTPILKTDSLLAKQKKDSVLLTAPVKPNTPLAADSLKALQATIVMSVSGFYAPEMYRNMIKSYAGSFDVKHETPNLRFSSGARFELCFRDKLEVNVGIAYSQINQEFHSETLFFPKNISQPFVFNSSLGDMSVPVSTMLSSFNKLAPVTDFKCNYQYAQTVQFINIPINAKLNFKKGRFGFYARAGINIQYAYSEQATLELLKENETDRIDYNSLDVRKINYAALLGLGAEVRIVKHLSFSIEPEARLNLLPVTNSSAVKSDALFYGAAAGMKFEF